MKRVLTDEEQEELEMAATFEEQWELMVKFGLQEPL
jgi:hypothetical protein